MVKAVSSTETISRHLLIFRTQGRLCALPSEHINETMRPLAIQPMTTLVDFVVGVSIVRGCPMPIIDSRLLFENAAVAPARRLLSVRIGAARNLGMLVDEVLGLKSADQVKQHKLGGLLQAMRFEAVESLGLLDGELLTILKTAQVVPEEIWQGMERSPPI